MKQFVVTTAMGKRLIGKGMAQLPEIQAVLEKGTLVIIAGTTNGYVAEEILTALGQVEGFSRVGFRRGATRSPCRKLAKAEFPGDVVIVFPGTYDTGFGLRNDVSVIGMRGASVTTVSAPVECVAVAPLPISSVKSLPTVKLQVPSAEKRPPLKKS